METNDERATTHTHYQTHRMIIMEYHRIVATITVHFIRPIRDLALCERFAVSFHCLLSPEGINWCIVCSCVHLWFCWISFFYQFRNIFVCHFFSFIRSSIFVESFICVALMHVQFHWEKKNRRNSNRKGSKWSIKALKQSMHLSILILNILYHRSHHSGSFCIIRKQKQF